MASEFYTIYDSSTGAILRNLYIADTELADNYDPLTEDYEIGNYDANEYYWNGLTMAPRTTMSKAAVLYINDGRWYFIITNMNGENGDYFRYNINGQEIIKPVSITGVGSVGLVSEQDVDFNIYVGNTQAPNKEGWYEVQVTITGSGSSASVSTSTMQGSTGLVFIAPPAVDEEIILSELDTLDAIKAKEKNLIDDAAAEKRKEVLTVNPGQDYVYVQKLEEARHYLENVGLTYRYWKIDLQQAVRIQMSELEMASTIGGADVTTPSTVITASSENVAHPASHALDGNGATWWETTGTVGSHIYEHLIIDLGSPTTIAEVRMTALANSSLPRLNFSIYGSNDGVNWVETAFDKPDSQYNYTAGEQRAYNPEINDGYYVLMGPEASARGMTLLQLAEEVVGQRQTINAQLGEIEAIRITRKASIDAVVNSTYISKLPVFVKQAIDAFAAL